MLDMWECEDPDHVAALLTSEIVSNAVRHAASTVGLEVAIVDQRLRVEASDDALRQQWRPIRIGLEVKADSDCTSSNRSPGGGVDRYEDHKVVWFETTVQPRRRNLV